MRLKEFSTSTPQPPKLDPQDDPVFGNRELMSVVHHYLPAKTIAFLQSQSPYTPGSGNSFWRGIYDSSVAKYKDRLLEPNPDIKGIVAEIDRKIPGGIPDYIKQPILQTQQWDQANSAGQAHDYEIIR